MNNYKKLIGLLATTLVTLFSFTVFAGFNGIDGGFQPIFETFEEIDGSQESGTYWNDQASLLCYKSVVEFGNPLPPICAAMGWTVADLHTVDPFTLFGYVVTIFAAEGVRYNVCIVTPDVCLSPN